MPQPRFSSGARSYTINRRVKWRNRSMLKSFVGSGKRLTIHKIHGKILPVFAHSLERMMASGDSPSSFHDDLAKIKTDLSDIQGALERFVNYERYFNKKIRSLVGINLDDLLKDIGEFGKAQSLEDYSGEDDEDIFHRVQKKIDEMSNITSTLKVDLSVKSETVVEKADDAGAHHPPTRFHRMNATRWLVPAFRFHQRISYSFDFQKILGMYETLDKNSRRTMLCLSVFPDDSVIKRRALISWWIGEGFVDIDLQGFMTAKQMADLSFEELIAKGFIVPADEKKSPTVRRCRVHPSIRFIATILAQAASFYDADSMGKIHENSFSVSRRDWLLRTAQGSSQYALKICDPARLRSLFNVNESYIELPRSWLSRAKKVNVLQLGRWQGSAKHHIEVVNSEFLKSVGDLKQLRYLCLQGISHIQELPPMYNLSDLRILDLRACHNLERFPPGIASLKTLTYLDMSECYLINHMPKGLESLPNLQVLKGFVIGDPKTSKDLCKLSDLVNLKLRKLSIYIDVKFNSKVEMKCLPQFTVVRSLTITWIGNVDAIASADAKEYVHQHLRRLTRGTAFRSSIDLIPSLLPEELEKLDLRCYPGLFVLPEWLNLPSAKNLKKLYIRGGQIMHFKDVYSENDTVEIVRLKFLLELKIGWHELKKLFPNLKYFQKVGCPQLAFFPCDGHGVWTRSPYN